MKIFYCFLSAIIFVSGCGNAADTTATSPVVSEVAAAATFDTTTKPPNFLIMIGDDMGVETIGCYKVGNTPATTPNLNKLCNQGVRFDNFWSQAVCSPTRATILSGQYGFRNGVGTPATAPTADFRRPDLPANAPLETGRVAVAEVTDTPEVNAGMGAGAMGMGMGGMGAMGAGGMAGAMGANTDITENSPRADYIPPQNARPGLSIEARGLPGVLMSDANHDYQTAAIGKWHLADENNGALEHPAKVGFDHYSGSIRGGGVRSYYAWSKVIDGEITDGDTTYVTTQTVNDALSWLDEKQNDKPWLMWVAFNAPHSPWGAPPADLISEATRNSMTGKDVNEDAHPFYLAMIEAMDTEIGRLLESIDAEELANTYVIFLGDNGTPGQATRSPFEGGKSKGSLYQGGINVPLFIDGPNVDDGKATTSLANSVDLYATVLELAGVKSDAGSEYVLDSVSLVPVLNNTESKVRDFAYADRFGPTRAGIDDFRAIRNEQYKLIVNLAIDSSELYDLKVDPYEKNNLLAAALSKSAEDNYQQLQRLLGEMKLNRK